MSIVSGGVVPDLVEVIAGNLGRLFTRRGHTIVCGGLGGVMEAAYRGAEGVGSTTIDALPGEDREGADSYVDVPITTGLNHARNALVATDGDAVIAVDDGSGMLPEIGYANVFDRPTAGIKAQQVDSLEGFEPRDSPGAAVAFVKGTV